MIPRLEITVPTRGFSRRMRFAQLGVMALLATLASSAGADDVVFRGLDSAKSYTLQKVNGVWKVSPLTAVVVVGEKPTVPPLPSDSLAGKVQAETAKIKAGATVTRALIESNVRVLQKGVADGSIAFGDVFVGKKLFSSVYETLLREERAVDQWKPFRDWLGEELGTLAQDKKLDEKSEVLAVLKAIADGHSAYLASSGFLDRINWDRILRLVGLLEKFFPEATIAKTVIEILREIKGREAR